MSLALPSCCSCPNALQLIIYGVFAIALIYGAFRVVAGKYSGGDVMSVLVAVLTGGFAIGQAAPNIQYFVKGRTAGARIMQVWLWWFLINTMLASQGVFHKTCTHFDAYVDSEFAVPPQL